MGILPDIPDDEVGLTHRARQKATRFYKQDQARARVRDLHGRLFLRHGDSDHDQPEFHLYDEDTDWSIVFVVDEDKPIIITQCHRHWNYEQDERFTYIGRGA